MTRDYILEGFDPTSIPPGSCLTLSQLLQMVHAAQPVSDIGFLIVSVAPPDVATYPVLARFLWINATGSLYWYNGASWSLVATNVSIAPGTVLPSMLGVDTGLPYQVLAVAASGLSVTFQDIKALIGASGVTTMAGYGTQKFLTIDAATLKLCGVDPSAFPASSVAWSKVASAAGIAGQYPLRDGAGGWTWATPGSLVIPDSAVKILASSKLSAAGGTAGQSIRVPAVPTGFFEFYTPPVIPGLLPYYVSSLTAVPTVGTYLTFAHGKGVAPHAIRAVLVRTGTALYGYGQFEELDLTGIQAGSNRQCFTVSADVTNIYVTRSNDSNVVVMRRDTGVQIDISGAIAIGDWAIKVYANTLYNTLAL
jgi:hypothetical protein